MSDNAVRTESCISEMLVSLCIPTYNNADVLADALQSAMAQSYSSLEILVLDNHSSDATEDLVRRVTGGDARVRYVRHSENIGMGGNFNSALSISKGELILVLCADDVLERTCVEVLAAALVEEPSAVLAACSRLNVNLQLKPLNVVRSRTRRHTISGSELMRECFAKGNIIGEPSAVLFRRRAAARGFCVSYLQLIDLEMWFHLLSQGDAILLPDVLCRIRKHPGQWTSENIRSGRLLADKRAFFRDFASRISRQLTMKEKLRWDARMASSADKTRRSGGEGLAKVQEVFYPWAFTAFRWIIAALRAPTLPFRSRTD